VLVNQSSVCASSAAADRSRGVTVGLATAQREHRLPATAAEAVRQHAGLVHPTPIPSAIRPPSPMTAARSTPYLRRIGRGEGQRNRCLIQAPLQGVAVEGGAASPWSRGAEGQCVWRSARPCGGGGRGARCSRLAIPRGSMAPKSGSPSPAMAAIPSRATTTAQHARRSRPAAAAGPALPAWSRALRSNCRCDQLGTSAHAFRHPAGALRPRYTDHFAPVATTPWRFVHRGLSRLAHAGRPSRSTPGSNRCWRRSEPARGPCACPLPDEASTNLASGRQPRTAAGPERQSRLHLFWRTQSNTGMLECLDTALVREEPRKPSRLYWAPCPCCSSGL